MNNFMNNFIDIFKNIFKNIFNRNSVYLVVLFTAIWVILTENTSALSIAAGFAIGCACIYCCHRFLSMDRIDDVHIGRLMLYIFYLIGQMYLAGFAAIKLIIMGAKTDVVTVRTDISSRFLRVLLANSITLTPGTLTLDLSGDRLTVLWLRPKASAPVGIEAAGEQIKGKLERQLQKAHNPGKAGSGAAGGGRRAARINDT